MNGSMAFLARLLLASIFFVGGVRKALAFKAVSGMMAAKGFPIADVFLVASIALDIIGGILLVMNWNARYAAIALAVYTFALAFFFHGFWNFFDAPPREFDSQLNSFMKNLSIVGGLLLFASTRPRDESHA